MAETLEPKSDLEISPADAAESAEAKAARLLGLPLEPTEDQIIAALEFNEKLATGDAESEELKNAADILFDKFNERRDAKIAAEKESAGLTETKENVDDATANPAEALAETQVIAQQETVEIPKGVDLDPNFAETGKGESEKELTPEMVETKLRRIIDKASRVSTELKNNGVNANVDLLTEYLNKVDRDKLSKNNEKLTEKQVAWLAEQCREIIAMAQERVILLDGIDPSDKDTLKDLNKKIKKTEVKEGIKENLKKEYLDLVDSTQNLLRQYIVEFGKTNVEAHGYFYAKSLTLKSKLPEEKEKVEKASLQQLEAYVRLRRERFEKYQAVAEEFRHLQLKEEPKVEEKKQATDESEVERLKKEADAGYTVMPDAEAPEGEQLEDNDENSAEPIPKSRNLFTSGWNNLKWGFKQIGRDFEEAWDKNFGKKEEEVEEQLYECQRCRYRFKADEHPTCPSCETPVVKVKKIEVNDLPDSTKAKLDELKDERKKDLADQAPVIAEAPVPAVVVPEPANVSKPEQISPEEEAGKLRREALNQFKPTGDLGKDAEEFFRITGREICISKNPKRTVDNFRELADSLLAMKNDTNLSDELKNDLEAEAEFMKSVIDNARKTAEGGGKTEGGGAKEEKPDVDLVAEIKDIFDITGEDVTKNYIASEFVRLRGKYSFRNKKKLTLEELGNYDKVRKTLDKMRELNKDEGVPIQDTIYDILKGK